MKIPILFDIECFIRRIRCKNEIKKDKNMIKTKQDLAFQKNFKKSKKMIVFVNFEDNHFCGGVMSIFNFATMSRALFNVHGCDVLHATLFTNKDKYYIEQTKFKNNETIYRLAQVMEYANKLDTLIIHIPEMLMEDFTKRLTPEYKNKLKQIPNLRINVLNQNIEVFSPLETWAELRTITDNITQTTGFDKYTTQEICNKFEIPLYRLIGYSSLHENYEKVKFEDKEKLFIYSPDPHTDKEKVLNILKKGLPEFRFQQIQDLTFDEFMETAQKAMFSLTFGEGFDGYFTTIHFVGGLGLTVYNETFFPDKRFLDYSTVYKSYESLAENIIKDIELYLNNTDVYNDISQRCGDLCIETAYNKQLTYDLLEKFYKKEPTFIPQKITNKI